MNSAGAECVRPDAVSEDDIIAYVDGEAPAHVVDHVQSCPRCQDEAGRAARTQRWLRQALYRFDCPSPQTLGDYALTHLSPEDRTQVAQHVTECPRCADELQTLRAFLSVEPEPQLSPLERLRRVVATLVTLPAAPAMGYAGLRGSSVSTAQTYRADGLTITLSTSVKVRRGLVTLSGLVLRDGDGPDVSPAGDVVLTDASGAARTEQVDTLGNFTFEAVAPGRYQLELRLEDQIVTIEEVQVGG